MDVGRDLTVQSLQDTSKEKSSSWSAGIDVTVGHGVNISGNVGFGQGKGNADWVGGQTSIVGHEQVDIYTEGNTHIKGAIIASDKDGVLTLLPSAMKKFMTVTKVATGTLALLAVLPWMADLKRAIPFLVKTLLITVSLLNMMTLSTKVGYINYENLFYSRRFS